MTLKPSFDKDWHCERIVTEARRHQWTESQPRYSTFNCCETKQERDSPFIIAETRYKLILMREFKELQFNDYVTYLSGVKVNKRDKDGWAALHLAVENKNVETVNMLLNAGAKVNIFIKKKWTPLHMAAKENNGLPIVSKNWKYIYTYFVGRNRDTKIT